MSGKVAVLDARVKASQNMAKISYPWNVIDPTSTVRLAKTAPRDSVMVVEWILMTIIANPEHYGRHHWGWQCRL
jgi:hypothetical protein